MKIAYLSTFYPYRGGIAQFNAALYRRLELQYETRAYTFLRQYPEMLFPGSSQLVQPDDETDKVLAEKVLDTINPLGYYRAAGKIKRFKPDLFITKFWMPFFAPSLGTVAKNLSPSTIKISILDNVIPHEKRVGDMAFTKFFLNQNDGFVVMSDTVKDDLLSLKPEARFVQHVHPLYDHFGAKVSPKIARDKLDLPQNKKIILFFGFVRDYKGLDVLLEAMKSLPEDYHLLIGGEVYGSFDKYDKLIEKLGLESRVTKHIRYIADNEVPLFFSASDVCVLPYKSATQSVITAIAYHFDVPMIATNVGSLKEMIEPGKTGMLVESPKPELIKNAILEVFSKDLIPLFQSNMEKFKQTASWESLANAVLDLYYEIINERNERDKKIPKLM